jgi:hypothetical protein
VGLLEEEEVVEPETSVEAAVVAVVRAVEEAKTDVTYYIHFEPLAGLPEQHRNKNSPGMTRIGQRKSLPLSCNLPTTLGAL